MKLTPIISTLAAGTMLAGAAHADLEDYHGFNPEVVDALNERLEQPLTGDTLAALSDHVGIEACGGSNTVEMQTPDGWETRMQAAKDRENNGAMPVLTESPTLDYPPLYNALGVEGVCEVMLDVTASGEPENVLTNCTLPAFGDRARGMVSDLEFAAGDGADSPAIDNIIMPVNYCRPDKTEEG